MCLGRLKKSSLSAINCTKKERKSKANQSAIFTPKFLSHENEISSRDKPHGDTIDKLNAHFSIFT